MAHIIMYACKSAPLYGRGRGLWGPVGVGWCACDKTNTINHVHALGSEGSAGGPYIMHSASDTIGPGGWGQRSGREPARQVWCVCRCDRVKRVDGEEQGEGQE